MPSKEEWRAALAAAGVTDLGQMAERVRRLPAYRRCQRVFVSPALELAQVRINALLDGKELIMPGPGLKDGFYRLPPYRLPFAKLALAVSLKGLPQHGQLLPHEALAGLEVGMLFTEALAVDSQGQRLGDGSGFFDLGCALLHQCGALVSGVEVWAAAVRGRVEALPVDPWDVPMHGLVSAREEVIFPAPALLPLIDWRQLNEQRIRKIGPLWKEWRRGPGREG